MEKWQDILTAPKDGTEFWAYDPTANFDGTPYMQKCNWYDGPESGAWLMVDEQCGGANKANPTLWMPLPRTPEL